MEASSQTRTLPPITFQLLRRNRIVLVKITFKDLLSSDERQASGLKLNKDRLTLQFCSNASGSLMLKALLIAHSENLRTLDFKQKGMDDIYTVSRCCCFLIMLHRFLMVCDITELQSCFFHQELFYFHRK